ncbi:MAG TPA: HD domain-containing protein [Candidatus Saccharimonadales bacterium]|jgi:uncharacterized protein
MATERTDKLTESLHELYQTRGDLLFHGWHHIFFVTKKAVEFADEFPDVDKELVEAAALTHDLNYVVEVNTEPEAGRKLRAQYLADAGFAPPDEIAQIERIVMEEHTATRHADISDAAKALSDADSLFKIMPLTPIFFSSKYIAENRVDVYRWADKIIKEQKPLLEQGIYFYTRTARQKYLHWAEMNLELVEEVQAALEDPDFAEMLVIARELEVL